MRSSIILQVVLILSSNITFCQIVVDLSSKPQVSYSDYEDLVREVKGIREERLISLDQFIEFQKEKNTIILDTRSEKNYKAIHIKGAINLPFTEFTTGNLRKLIPDINTRILIYCNNNIQGDRIYFGSKTYNPEDEKKRKKYNKKSTFVPKSTAVYNSKTISLALNVPTYINLYGYGYRNIYELNELVNIKNPKVKFKKKKK